MTLNRILRYGIYVGIFALLLTPLIVAPSLFFPWSMYFPFITGKNFFFRIVVELVFGLWLILAYRDRKARPQNSYLLWAIGLYLLVETAAAVFGVNPTRSFWSNFERMDGLLTYYHIGLLFLVVVSVFKTNKIWRRFFQTSLAVSLLTAGYGFLQLFGLAVIHQSGSRLDASLGNSAYLAVYMLFNLALVAWLYLSSNNKLAKYYYLLAGVLEMIVLYYTATRGATLGFILGVIIFLALLAWKKTGRTRKVSLLVLGSLVLVAAIFAGLKNTSFVQNNQVLSRYASLSLTGDALMPRKQIWTMAWEGFKDRPWLGYGLENFPVVFQEYYTPQMYSQEPWFDRSHNVVFDKLISSGLLGLLAYLSIFAAAGYYLSRRNRGEDWTLRAVLLALLAAYLFQNLTVFDQIISLLMFSLVLAFIHFKYTTPPDELSEGTEKEKVWLPFVVVAVVGAVGFSLYYFNLRSMIVSTSLIRAISGQETPEAILSEYQRIFSYGPVTGQIEAGEQLLNTTQTIVANTSIGEAVKQQFVVLSDQVIQKEFAAEPNDARERMLYGSYLASIGRNSDALVQLQKALDLSPKKQMIMFQLGMVYINDDQVDLGLNYFKQAYEEDTSYVEARKLYALAALYTGHQQLAQDLLGSKPLEYLDDDRFVNYFASIKDYQSLLPIWQKRQQEKPTDKQTNLSLSACYYYLGQKDKAIEVIENYIKQDPSYAADGQKIIAQIRQGKI